MTNLFNHKTPENEFIIYATINGKATPITFYDKHSPYSNTMSSRGTQYEEDIESRNIEFTTEDKATRMKSLSSFVKWSVNARTEVELFLEQNNITINDLKVVKITSPEPKEELLSIDLSILT